MYSGISMQIQAKDNVRFSAEGVWRLDISRRPLSTSGIFKNEKKNIDISNSRTLSARYENHDLL